MAWSQFLNVAARAEVGLERSAALEWPAEGLARVPFQVYNDPQIAADEQARLFRSEVWNLICLDLEIGEIFGPAKTPQGVVDWMAQEIIAAAKTPEVQAQLADLGGETDLRGPVAFRAYLRAESERWGRIIRAAKIQVQ